MSETIKFESTAEAWEKLTQAGFSMQRVTGDIVVVTENTGYPVESLNMKSAVGKLGKDGEVQLTEEGQRHHDKIAALLRG